MRKKSIVIILSVLFWLPCSAFAEPVDVDVLMAARNFVEKVDDGEFQAAYRSGSSLMQQLDDESSWLESTRRSQLVLGKVKSRELRRIRAVTSPAKLPDDDYRILLFDSKTDKKQKASEVFILHQIKGNWRVCQYSIL